MVMIMENKINKKSGYILATIVLSCIILAIYYFFVYKNTESTRENLENQISDIEQQIELEKSKTLKITSMKNEISLFKEAGLVYEYDIEGLELEYLNQIMEKADNYDLSFDKPVKSGDDFVKRKVSIRFNAENYYKSIEIITDIIKSPYRTVIKGFSITPYGGSNTDNIFDKSLSGDSRVSVSLDIVFIEYIVASTDIRGLG